MTDITAAKAAGYRAAYARTLDGMAWHIYAPDGRLVFKLIERYQLDEFTEADAWQAAFEDGIVEVVQ